ncbi:VanW family protein [Rhodococcus sp. OK302]|uniref:VanW family protein n=1 Tax=Rhodococcus sp. OK302 TaxID=1882769 RepID=UPI000B9F29FB|nr:VanW family protein [Rhodococcus sp. OK302]OYD66552.1 vancomycin resistance protein YoaR [Rhodococcus sp. OK302]
MSDTDGSPPEATNGVDGSETGSDSTADSPNAAGGSETSSADAADAADAADVADVAAEESADFTADESANEITTVIPAVPAYVQQFEPTEQFTPTQHFEPVVRDPEPVPETPTAPSRPWVKPALILAGIFAIGVLAYGLDVFTSSGNTPRGTQVAGIDIGNLSPADAEIVLRSELGPRLVEPVAVSADGSDSQIIPASAGIDVDWSATLAGVNAQPLNPITRITSFFTSREVPVVSTVDEAALNASMTVVAANSDRAPVEGAIVISDGQASGVSPVVGRALDLPGAASTFTKEWSDGSIVVLPVDDIPVTVTQAGVDSALKDVAQPAVSGEIVVNGRDGKEASIGVEQIGEILSFTPDGSGGLTPQYNTDAAIKILAPQLVSTEVQPKDASITLAGGKPTVVPGVVGDLINWPETVKDLPVLLSSTASRATPAVYGAVPPALTTEAAEGLGIKEVISEYTTGGFEYASGVNIALAASVINGAIVKPGDTFSFNEFTGPRGAAQGYVESGIINNGRPDKAVGGGISQLATTLYNATYFAGMDDIAHTEHSYYISRYPAAREATIFDGAIDLQFRNPSKTGVMIETITTSSQVTVRIWGTKTVDVESITGPRTSPTSPNTVVLPKGPGCVPSSGAPGFTTSDTRVITDHATGAEISRNTRTVKYDPVPIVKCE